MNRIFVLFLIFSTASVFLTILPVSAQYDTLSIEEQLKLAEDRLFPNQTYSNLTLAQFPGHLSNMTLSQEQVTEIEKDRSAIFISCIERMSQKERKLCDAFADYLMEKCKRFDNLLAYCTGQEVIPAIYGLKRLEQLSCLKNPPLYSDSEKIRVCMNSVVLNSSYYDRPPFLVSTKSIKDKSYYDVTYHVILTAKNEGIVPITFEKLIYDFYKEGKKLTSGCVGPKQLPSGCHSPNTYTIPGLSSDNYQFDYTVGTNQSGIPPFILNGTYHRQFKQNNNRYAFSFVIH